MTERKKERTKKGVKNEKIEMKKERKNDAKIKKVMKDRKNECEEGKERKKERNGLKIGRSEVFCGISTLLGYSIPKC